MGSQTCLLYSYSAPHASQIGHASRLNSCQPMLQHQGEWPRAMSVCLSSVAGTVVESQTHAVVGSHGAWHAMVGSHGLWHAMVWSHGA